MANAATKNPIEKIAAESEHVKPEVKAAKLTLEGRGNSGSHGFRTCAGQTGADGDGWKINVWERRNRQESECHQTREKDGDGDE